jgi:hypothetical protein
MLAGWLRVPQVAPVEPVYPAEPVYLKIYPSVRGFSGPVTKKLKKILIEFHKGADPMVREILSNNQQFGIHFRQTRIGDGLFNGPVRIPRGRRIAIYIAAISTDTQFKRDKDHTYGYTMDLMFEYECVLDGQFYISEKKPYNGSFLNHSCTPNCRPNEETEPGTLVKYLSFVTTHGIGPWEQLLIDYNRGSGLLARGGYWEHISFLGHVPAWALVRCACALPVCPKHRGFDLRMKRPAEAAILAGMV